MSETLAGAVRHRLETAGPPDLSALAAASVNVRGGARGPDLVAVLSAQVFAGFVAPEAVAPVYDTLASAWLGDTGGAASAGPALGRGMPPEAFWGALDALLSDAGAGRLDANGFTVRTAELGGCLAEDFPARAERQAYAYPAVAELAQRPFPPRLELKHLQNRPEGSLGRVLHDLLVANGYQPEVFERDTLDMERLHAQPPALRYLNGRILSVHDVFHLVAGYRLTVLGEVGVSAFSLAQFGHPYSAMLVTAVALLSGEAPILPMVLQVTAEAWRHGRRTPAMMAIDWDAEWDRPIADIRARHGIAAFSGAYPQDLLELARAAA